VKPGEAARPLAAVDPAILKDSFLSEVRKAKKYFYNTVVAQAQRIEFSADKVVFTFAPQHRALRDQLESIRSWLETAASQLAGRKIIVAAAEGPASLDASNRPSSLAAAGFGEAGQTSGSGAVEDAGDRAKTLKERALSDPGVQTMLDVFAAEIKDVEER
jgi:hypothetical protein